MFGNFPFPGMEDFYQNLETRISEWMEKSLTSPDVLKSIGKTMDSTLSSKSFAEKIQNQILHSSSIPTTAQITRISQQILSIEGKQCEQEDLMYQNQTQIQELSDKMNTIIENQMKILTLLEKESKTSSTPPSEKKAKKAAPVKAPKKTTSRKKSQSE